MKLTPNDRYLTLLLKALGDTIEPELQSSNAKASLGLIKGVIGELLKREHGTHALLREVISQALQLADSINAALGQPAEDHRTSLALLDRSDASLQSLLDEYEARCVDLDKLGAALAQSTLPDQQAHELLKQLAQWELSYYARQAALPQPTLPTIENQKEPLSAESLQGFLNSQADGGDITVTELRPLPGGFGKQTYFASYQRAGDSTHHELVVRKTDPAPIMTHGACDLESEFALLKTLSAVDYPAPKPISFAKHYGNVDECFYTMPRSPGDIPGTFLGGLNEGVDEEFFMQLAQRLGELHALPLDMFADYIKEYEDPRILTGNVSQCYQYNLDGWDRYMAREGHLASPYMRWLLTWLRRNTPQDDRRPILVHGDFNVHNILFENGKLTTVLDWECSGFGSPEQDLAYIKPHISQHIDWDRFIQHYQAHGGLPVVPSAMAFGFVYSALRTNLAGNRGTSNLQIGRNQDLRYSMVELGFTRSFMDMALTSAYPNN